MSAASTRLAIAQGIAREAGMHALRFFRDVGALDISAKGRQDFVSNADLEVEMLVRARLAERFPEDGIIGEEHAPVASSSGWTWVIDPIDGTANFIVGLPQWCVILACVFEDETRLGVIYDPCAQELFTAVQGEGAKLNGAPMQVSRAKGLDEGRTGIGMNARTPPQYAPRLLSALAEKGGLLFHNASGGLMLAYVASGRLIGYAEPHMNAWDCLAGQLMVAEAGGEIEQQSAKTMLAKGGQVIAAAPGVFVPLKALTETSWAEKRADDTPA